MKNKGKTELINKEIAPGATLMWEYDNPNPFDCLSLSSDGSLIAAISMEQVHFFTKDGHYFSAHQKCGHFFSTVRHVSLSSDGACLAAAGGKNIYLFNKNGNLLWTRKIEAGCSSLFLSGDGAFMAAGAGKIVYFFDGRGDLLWRYDTACSDLLVVVTADGSFVYAGSGKQVNVLNRQGKLSGRCDLHGPCTSIGLAQDVDYIAVGTDKSIGCLDQSGSLLWHRDLGKRITALSISGDGSHAVTAAGKQISCFGAQGELAWCFEKDGFLAGIDRVVTSSDGAFTAAIGDGGALMLFDNEGACLWNERVGYGSGHLAVSADGAYVAVARSRHLCFIRNELARRDNMEEPFTAAPHPEPQPSRTYITEKETITKLERTIPVIVTEQPPLNCGSCGAPSKGAAGAVCEYCGSRIQNIQKISRVE